MENMLRLFMITIQVVAQVNAATRNMSQRIEVGECSTNVLGQGDTYFPTTKQANFDSISANLFDIYYGDTFKVVVSHKAKEQYVLTQCGQTQPSDKQVNLTHSSLLDTSFTRKHFSVPIQSAIVAGTVHAGFLENLQVYDRVKYVSMYASAPCWQKIMSCNGTYGSTPKIQQEQMNSGVDAVFMDCSGDCSNVRNQPNGINAAASQDPSPLKSAEYIKFFGAFFNKEHLAVEIYNAVKTAYNLVSTNQANKPTVAWLSYSAYEGGCWCKEAFVVSTAAYKLDLVRAAGGQNFNASVALASIPGVTISGDKYLFLFSDFNNSKANASSYLLAALASVNVVIDETYASDATTYSLDSFKTTFGISSSSSLTFMQQQKVLRLDLDMNLAANGNAWFESRIPRPDWAVEGLGHYLADDNSKRRKYFRNIATGEGVNALSSTACSKTLPACAPTTYSEAIPLLQDTTTTTSAASTTTQPNPDTTATQPSVTQTNQVIQDAGTTTQPSATIAGKFTFTVGNPSAILNDATVKRKFEEKMEKSIANDAGVSADACDVKASAGARRLGSAEPRQLTGKIKIDYTITTTNAESATVLASVKTSMTVEKITQTTQEAIRGIDAALCSECATATVTGAEIISIPQTIQDTSAASTTTPGQEVNAAISTYPCIFFGFVLANLCVIL